MIVLEKNFDDLLKCNYTLYSVKYLELKKLVKSWYSEYDLSEFDRHFDSNPEDIDLKVEKKAALLSTFFYAYKENDKFYLLDGFNRLLTNYGDLDIDTTVYIKIIDDKLEDYQLMSLMFNLNLWKLYNSGYTYSGFNLNNFMDRGFRLLLKSKFDIVFYYSKGTRIRSYDDIDVLDHYFRDECEEWDSFKYKIKYVAALFLNKNIMSDFKDILNSNNYLDKPFAHYDKFLEGYAKFLSNRRLKNDNNEYKFEYFLRELYKDTKFFKKIQNMSSNDSTRKNIYKFYRNLNITPDFFM